MHGSCDTRSRWIIKHPMSRFNDFLCLPLFLITAVWTKRHNCLLLTVNNISGIINLWWSLEFSNSTIISKTFLHIKDWIFCSNFWCRLDCLIQSNPSYHIIKQKGKKQSKRNRNKASIIIITHPSTIGVFWHSFGAIENGRAASSSFMRDSVPHQTPMQLITRAKGEK